jgi:hypothetical protein
MPRTPNQPDSSPANGGAEHTHPAIPPGSGDALPLPVDSVSGAVAEAPLAGPAWADPAIRGAVTTPPATGPLSNAQVLHGPAVTPLQRLGLYSDEEFEAFIQEWAFAAVPKRYAHVAWAPGAGDRGRDVIGYEDDDLTRSSFDVYQCKRYGSPLTPSEMWVEFGKVCVYTYRGVYRMPRRYLFVAPHGVGPSLLALLENPEELKRQLKTEWSAKCARGISSREVIPLEGDLLRHVEGFDFSIFGYVEPLTIIEELRETAYYSRRFGGGLQRRRPVPPPPPAELETRENRYVAQLLGAYGDHCGRPFPTALALQEEALLHGHFVRQREAFYRAESLREFERDTLADDSGFGELKEEIYRGVVDVCEGSHRTGYERVIAVTSEARRLQLTRYVLVDELHIEDRTGLCHHLANEDRLIWVPS